jgi:molybdate transport system substrate-binding protein
MSMRRILAVTLAHAVNSGIAAADEAQMAVAANFSAPAKQLAAQFEKATGHRLALSSGSTGKFYAQISNGAPFDVLLAADSETPRRMEQEKLAVSGSRFTYALGKLVLWSPREGVVDDRGEVLRTGTFRRLSLANPRLAPYGAAAQEAMERLGAWATLQDRLVMGENIAQAFQFVATGNAELGFVAYSQVREPGKPLAGSFWLVPQSLYAPLRQDAVLLAHGASNAAAREFLAFLRSAPALELIRGYGYELP